MINIDIILIVLGIAFIISSLLNKKNPKDYKYNITYVCIELNKSDNDNIIHNYTYFKDHNTIEIGCIEKSIDEWNIFFNSSKKEYNNARNSREFKIIKKDYEIFLNKIISYGYIK